MKSPYFRFIAILFQIFSLNFSANAQNPDPNLKILAPRLDKSWVGELKAPDGSASWKTTHEFKALWDGTVVKYTGSTSQMNSFAEGYFYWDRAEQKVAVLIINNKGIYQKGLVMLEDSLITIKGTISFPERTFEFKNTFEFTAEGKMIDRWFQNAFGPWRPGHVIEFTETK
ncbi:hypothetical protein JW964_19060 [candidate division KSB1 bacterium]|nr:hypothetical protein [candidate division KSB1 bacterium]